MRVSGIFDSVERWHNWASDTNFVWFPFLKLKLAANESMTQQRILMMTVCFSCYFNAMYLVKKVIFAEPLSVRSGVVSQAYFMVGFFIWFSLVTKPLWNRRVNRLKLGGVA